MTKPSPSNTAWAREEAERIYESCCNYDDCGENGCHMPKLIESALLAAERKAKARCAIAASEAPADDLPPFFEPTDHNKLIWSTAHAAGVLRATTAISSTLPPTSKAE